MRVCVGYAGDAILRVQWGTVDLTSQKKRGKLKIGEAMAPMGTQKSHWAWHQWERREIDIDLLNKINDAQPGDFI